MHFYHARPQSAEDWATDLRVVVNRNEGEVFGLLDDSGPEFGLDEGVLALIERPLSCTSRLWKREADVHTQQCVQHVFALLLLFVVGLPYDNTNMQQSMSGSWWEHRY